MATKKETSADHSSALSAVVAQIQKQYGEGAIVKLGEASASTTIESISAGALTVDLALGIGGLPRGRIVEVFGPESSGKTTLVLHVIANAQKEGGTAAFSSKAPLWGMGPSPRGTTMTSHWTGKVHIIPRPASPEHSFWMDRTYQEKGSIFTQMAAQFRAIGL